jgi:membrane protein insertase Oxa1/YidC/SpoIIIJ
MKTKNKLFSSQEGYLIIGLVSIMGIALLPLILGIPLSFGFAVSYWATVIALAIGLAALILVQQTKEIKKSEKQIRILENTVKGIKKKAEIEVEA